MTAGILVRGWRISAIEPDGLSCYFDPMSERIEIHPLTDEEKAVRLDMVGSVSAPQDAGRAIIQSEMFPEGSDGSY